MFAELRPEALSGEGKQAKEFIEFNSVLLESNDLNEQQLMCIELYIEHLKKKQDRLKITAKEAIG